VQCSLSFAPNTCRSVPSVRDAFVLLWTPTPFAWATQVNIRVCLLSFSLFCSEWRQRETHARNRHLCSKCETLPNHIFTTNWPNDRTHKENTSITNSIHIVWCLFADHKPNWNPPSVSSPSLSIFFITSVSLSSSHTHSFSNFKTLSRKYKNKKTRKIVRRKRKTKKKSWPPLDQWS